MMKQRRETIAEVITHQQLRLGIGRGQLRFGLRLGTNLDWFEFNDLVLLKIYIKY